MNKPRPSGCCRRFLQCDLLALMHNYLPQASCMFATTHGSALPASDGRALDVVDVVDDR